MSQHFVKDKNGREWIVGYDNPCQGFFASRIATDEYEQATGQDCDILIGFGNGIDLKSLILECGKYDLVLYEHEGLIEELINDRLREIKPLSPLQEMVRAMAKEAGAFDE
jgi:hypothetical protein